MRQRRWVSVALVVALAGCGARSATEPPPVGESGDRLRQQAREALERYDQAVAAAGGSQGIVVVGERMGQVGDWEAGKELYKESLNAGKVKAAGVLPKAPQPGGEVVWDGGGSRTVAIIGAAEALEELVKGGAGSCAECGTIEVTGARLGTAKIQTARGAATAPAWEFTVEGSAVLVTRVAFAVSAGVTVVPPPWNASNPPRGLRIDSATVNGTTLTAQFVGAPNPATGPCGIDYTAEAVESANAVVVIILEHRYSDHESCTAIGGSRTATVELRAPLGDRAVLEVQQGMPVTVG
ncbi:hypothetical protein [Dactylosporangium sp. NPDC005555]|uniref:hypothetical protein n=1 Tax=Dactylosporangium sp. NPDC005555 TaxID=3154889 RepID=UPI0033AB3BAA